MVYLSALTRLKFQFCGFAVPNELKWGQMRLGIQLLLTAVVTGPFFSCYQRFPAFVRTLPSHEFGSNAPEFR